MERERAIARASALITDVAGGDLGGALIVQGPPGIGKSTVLGVAAQRAQGMGFHLLRAAGGEFETDVTYGVARQLFLEGGHSAVDGSAALRRARDLLAEPAGLLHAGAASREALLLQACFEACMDIGARQPLLLLIDDVHWADAPSGRLLSYLSRRLRRLRLAVLLGARAGIPNSCPAEVVSVLEALGPPETLPPLSLDAVRVVLNHQFAGPVDERFAQACAQATGGNPLLLEELITELGETGLRPVAESADRVVELGSSTIAASVKARMSRLPPAATAVAEAVTVLGASAQLPLAANLAGVPVEVAGEAADMLVAADILVPGEPLRFAHPIVRSALHRHMPPWRCGVLHARAAPLLLAAGHPLQEVASHLLAAPPRDDPWVRRTLADAADAASRGGTPEAAIGYLRRAIAENCGEDPLLLLALGRAEHTLGLEAAASTLGELVDRLLDPQAKEPYDQPVLAEAALLHARTLTHRGRWRDALTVIERVIPCVQAHRPGLLRLQAERLWVLEAGGTDPGEYVRSALALGSSLTGESAEERLLLVHYASVRFFSCAPAEEVIDTARRALAEGDLLRVETADSLSWVYAVGLLWACGDYDGALEEYAAGAAEALARGATATAAATMATRSWIMFELGDLDQAEMLARAAGGATGRGGEGFRYAGAALAATLGEQGRIHEALELVESYGVEEGAAELDRFDALLLHVRADLHAVLGDPQAAISDLRRVGDWCERHLIANPAEWAWRTDLAPLLAAAGHIDEARTLVEVDLERAARFGVPRPWGRALHAAALVEPSSGRLARLEQAVDVLAVSPARLALARALIDLGSARRAAGDLGGARSALLEGLDLAHVCGAGPLVKRAREHLALLGVRPRRTARIGAASLTPMERRVAELVAEGLSNRDVATRLTVSVKTVEKHLGNVFAKLGIATRREVASALRR